jgi:hypothetical protein
MECSNFRAVAVGAAPAEHGRVAVQMSTIQKLLYRHCDLEAVPCARPFDEVDGNRAACTWTLMALFLQEGSACIEDCYGGQL